MVKKGSTPGYEPTSYSVAIDDAIIDINRKLGANKKRFTQYQLAKEAGIHQPTLSRILSGASKSPTRENILKIGEVLNSHLDYAIYLDAVGPHPKHGTLRRVHPRFEKQSLVFSINQVRLEKALALLDEDIPDWSQKPALNRARLIMMFYDTTEQES